MQATESSSTLAPLLERMRESQQMWLQIEPLLPGPLRNTTQAGKWESGVWCLLTKSNASAAKLRQLSPSLVQALQQRGWKVSAIRLKVQA